MIFTKMKPFKIWATYYNMHVDNIEKGLKEINKKGKVEAHYITNNTPPKPCPQPNSIYS